MKRFGNLFENPSRTIDKRPDTVSLIRKNDIVIDDDFPFYCIAKIIKPNELSNILF